MADRRILPYGSWPSPITVDMAVSSQISFREPRVFGHDVFWTEGRPQEQGRQVIERWNETDGVVDLTPPPFNARTMIHEYGGGWYTVDPTRGTLYFSNLPDGRIYRQERDSSPQPLTADGPVRFGDLIFDAQRNRLICIREDHAGLSPEHDAQDAGRIPEAVNELVAVDATSGEVQVLAKGYDFYSSPRLSRDDRLTWLSWRHPNMPWDERSCGSPTWMPQGAWQTSATLQAPPRSRSSNLSGRPTDRSSSCPIARAGGTCIAGPELARASRQPWLRCTLSLPDRSGSLACAGTPSLPMTARSMPGHAAARSRVACGRYRSTGNLCAWICPTSWSICAGGRRRQARVYRWLLVRAALDRRL